MNWRKIKIKNPQKDSETTSWIAENSNGQIVVSDSQKVFEVSNKKLKVHYIAISCRKKGVQVEPDSFIKLKVLKELGMWKKLALEVYPQESKKTERFCCGMWEVKNPENIEEIAEIPMFSKLEETAKVISSTGNVKFLFTTLEKWEDKQQLKNKLFSEESMAVELICDTFANKGYSCLIVFPDGRTVSLPLN